MAKFNSEFRKKISTFAEKYRFNISYLNSGNHGVCTLSSKRGNVDLELSDLTAFSDYNPRIYFLTNILFIQFDE